MESGNTGRDTATTTIHIRQEPPAQQMQMENGTLGPEDSNRPSVI